jgi:ribosomal protein S8
MYASNKELETIVLLQNSIVQTHFLSIMKRHSFINSLRRSQAELPTDNTTTGTMYKQFYETRFQR